MKVEKLTETVLLQLEALWVLQELEESIRQNDPRVTAWIRDLYQKRAVSWAQIQPVLRLGTTLSLLSIPISFANRLSEEELRGLSIRAEHEIVYREDGSQKEPTISEVLRVLRNALAHLPDFVSDGSSANISFDEGILRCRSDRKSSELVFQTEAGFIEFLRDLLPAIRRAAGELARSHAARGAA